MGSEGSSMQARQPSSRSFRSGLRGLNTPGRRSLLGGTLPSGDRDPALLPREAALLPLTDAALPGLGMRLAEARDVLHGRLLWWGESWLVGKHQDTALPYKPTWRR